MAAVRYFDMKQPCAQRLSDDSHGNRQKHYAKCGFSLSLRLFRNRTTNYVFNWDRMLDPKAPVLSLPCTLPWHAQLVQGNSAVFLFYAYARIRARGLLSSFQLVCSKEALGIMQS